MEASAMFLASDKSKGMPFVCHGREEALRTPVFAGQTPQKLRLTAQPSSEMLMRRTPRTAANLDPDMPPCWR